MRHTKIGHTLLTWDVFAHPENIERGIRDIAALGFAGTETGGSLYDWWEQHRPGQLKQILEDAGIPMVTLFHSGDWTEAAEEGRLLEDARRWSAAIADLRGEMLMLVPGLRRDIPPYGLDDFKRMADAMNRAGQIAHSAGITASMHPHWGCAGRKARPSPVPILTNQSPPNTKRAPSSSRSTSSANGSTSRPAQGLTPRSASSSATSR